jgi:putative transposase
VRRFDSVSYEDRSGWKLDQGAGRLYLMGVGHQKVRLHRRVPEGARLRCCVVRRQRVVRRTGHPPRARWTVTVAVELPDAAPLPPTGRRCGVDPGVRHLATVVDDGGAAAVVANPRPLAAATTRVAAAQQRLARAERGSNRRAKAVRQVAAAHGAQLRRHLSCKAAEAGREVVVVSAHHTSQACGRCGHTHPANRRGAVFRCRSCGHTADADANAAANILERAESARQPPAA